MVWVFILLWVWTIRGKVLCDILCVNYESSLKLLNLESLHDRRDFICFKFAKKSLRIENFKKMFPTQKQLHSMKKRNQKKYVENYAQTERYKKSSIPSMQRLLNRYERNLNSIIENVASCTNDLGLKRLSRCENLS